ncbi:11714_t:CDS:2, partial [Ambispora leptoticha]
MGWLMRQIEWLGICNRWSIKKEILYWSNPYLYFSLPYSNSPKKVKNQKALIVFVAATFLISE